MALVRQTLRCARTRRCRSREPRRPTRGARFGDLFSGTRQPRATCCDASTPASVAESRQHFGTRSVHDVARALQPARHQRRGCAHQGAAAITTPMSVGRGPDFLVRVAIRRRTPCTGIRRGPARAVWRGTRGPRRDRSRLERRLEGALVGLSRSDEGRDWPRPVSVAPGRGEVTVGSRASSTPRATPRQARWSPPRGTSQRWPARFGTAPHPASTPSPRHRPRYRTRATSARILTDRLDLLGGERGAVCARCRPSCYLPSQDQDAQLRLTG
jgi:hypothetical protein